MTEAHIRINGQDEILSVATLAALLEEKAVDTEQRGIAVALNGAVVPRADLAETVAHLLRLLQKLPAAAEVTD